MSLSLNPFTSAISSAKSAVSSVTNSFGGGFGGSIALLRDLNIARKVFIHINTTNPILIDDSAERAAVTAAGWEVAYDGMQLEV